MLIQGIRYQYDLRPSDIDGLGVYTLQDLPPNYPAMRYGGRIYMFDPAERPEDIDPKYSVETSLGVVIDATKDALGTGAEFINHSCRPNCMLWITPLGEQELPYGVDPYNVHEHVNRPGMIAHVVTRRQICVGEELTYRYIGGPSVDSLSQGIVQHRCKCKDRACRGTYARLPKDIEGIFKECEDSHLNTRPDIVQILEKEFQEGNTYAATITGLFRKP